jgi:hypothetical protein
MNKELDNEKWEISKIFSYKEREQEHPDDDIMYYGCTLLTDIGPFEKGHLCHICISPQTYASFTMSIDCDESGRGGEKFVPLWTWLRK